MTGRVRLAEAVAGQQPVRRWELTYRSTVRDTYAFGGYELDVFFTAAGAVRWAELLTDDRDGGGRRGVRRVSRGPNRADRVIAWIVDPAGAFE